MYDGHQESVAKFMELAGQEGLLTPGELTNECKLLRASIIMEECLETISKGLGVDVFDVGNSVNLEIKNLGFKVNRPFDIVELADGIADSSYVLAGIAVAAGINMAEIQKAVDENNLQKIGPGSGRRSDGKIIKPAGHQPPPIGQILKNQGWKN